MPPARIIGKVVEPHKYMYMYVLHKEDWYVQHQHWSCKNFHLEIIR